MGCFPSAETKTEKQKLSKRPLNSDAMILRVKLQRDKLVNKRNALERKSDKAF